MLWFYAFTVQCALSFDFSALYMSKHLERLAYADGQAPPTLGIIFNVIEILTHTQTIEVIKSTIEYF